jgi:hypothetical protein
MLRASCLLALACAVLGACAGTPQSNQDRVKAMEPEALAAAQERAQVDLGCATLRSTVVSTEHGDLSDAYGLRRAVYRVEATGCGMRARYAVACAVGSMCNAISDGIPERVRQP